MGELVFGTSPYESVSQPYPANRPLQENGLTQELPRKWWYLSPYACPGFSNGGGVKVHCSALSSSQTPLTEAISVKMGRLGALPPPPPPSPEHMPLLQDNLRETMCGLLRFRMEEELVYCLLQVLSLKWMAECNYARPTNCRPTQEPILLHGCWEF